MVPWRGERMKGGRKEGSSHQMLRVGRRAGASPARPTCTPTATVLTPRRPKFTEF